MSVVTKTGDEGETALVDGSRVPKSHPQIEAYGALDELNSHLGLCRSVIPEEASSQLEGSLRRIQNECFILGSHLALPPESAQTIQLPGLELIALAEMEEEVRSMEAQLPALTQFILPGGHHCASLLHLGRTVARRAERRIKELLDQQQHEAWSFALVYANRLSDWLFVAARMANHLTQSDEELWEIK